MIDQVRVDAAATAGWPDLVDELDRWDADGRIALLWWRDDDAVAPTPQLEDLLRLAGPVPLALAVIPALARPELADALAPHLRIAVVQHGWQHANRSGDGRKSEFPPGRPAGRVAVEIAAGQARLKAVFGARALPVLVPPWNRLADEFLPLLAATGITGLSVMATPRAAALPPGIAPLGVHLDLVAWRGDRGFIGADAALGGLVARLRARRLGEDEDAAAAGPIGILTHHLIMDAATAAFLDRLIGLAAGHAALRWAEVGGMLHGGMLAGGMPQ